MGRRYLSRLQRLVIDELFGDAVDEQEVLRHHNVSRAVFDRWLSEDAFQAELERRLQWCRLLSELILGRSKSKAAHQLVELTKSENPETARKACLDIIWMPDVGKSGAGKKGKDKSPEEVSPELAGRVLAAMAAADKSS